MTLERIIQIDKMSVSLVYMESRLVSLAPRYRLLLVYYV